MTTNPLSDAARRFLLDRIASLERLDVLLLLQRAPDRWWAAPALGVALGMSPESAQSHLETLGSLGLLDVRIAASVIYCYHPASPELSDLLGELSRAYFLDRGAVVAALLPRSPDGLRLFAEAFRLRKEKKDA